MDPHEHHDELLRSLSAASSSTSNDPSSSVATGSASNFADHPGILPEDCHSVAGSSTPAAGHDDDSPSLWMDMIEELIDLPPSPSFRQLGGTSSAPLAPVAAAASPYPFVDSFPTHFYRLAEEEHHLFSIPTATDRHFSPPIYDQSSSSRQSPRKPSISSKFTSYSNHYSPRFGTNFANKPYLRATNNLQKVSSAPQLTISSSTRLPSLSLPLHDKSPQQYSDFSDDLINKPASALSSTTPDSHQYRWFSQSRSPIISPSQLSRPPYNPHAISGWPHSLPSMGYLDSQSRGYQHTAMEELGGFSQFHDSEARLQQRHQLDMVPSISRAQTDEPQDGGLHLVHLLLACAEAVARDEYAVAKDALIQLQQIVSTLGDSMQRVAAYFTEALHARLTRTGGRSYMALRSYERATSEEVLAAYQVLYQGFPYIKFAHFTSNQAIFEAFEGEERVHIVDLDIIQGYQWPAFMQALAARRGGAPHLRITGVGMPLEVVQETGRTLAELAESLKVPFEFHAVGERLENLKAHMLQRRVGEALAINSVNPLHRLLFEPSALASILHMLWELAPNIFTLVEQEASHNGPFFLSRFLEALHYYSAIFDSLDATLPQDSPERTKVEQVLLAREIVNIVACEGSERVKRHEKLDTWRKIMETIGFQSVPLSANAVNQSRLLLGLYSCVGYTLVEDKGSLQLGWQDRLIIGASAWRC